MSRHEGDVRLRHMLDHAKEAVAMVRGRTRADLDTVGVIRRPVRSPAHLPDPISRVRLIINLNPA